MLTLLPDYTVKMKVPPYQAKAKPFGPPESIQEASRNPSTVILYRIPMAFKHNPQVRPDLGWKTHSPQPSVQEPLDDASEPSLWPTSCRAAVEEGEAPASGNGRTTPKRWSYIKTFLSAHH